MMRPFVCLFIRLSSPVFTIMQFVLRPAGWGLLVSSSIHLFNLVFGVIISI